MASAKEIEIRPITSALARAVVRKFHYSGKVVNNSQIHLGVYFRGALEGAMQFGPPMDKSKLLPLVRDTKWGGMIELNRMAFGPALPRNSESRALAVAFRMLRKHYPKIEWVVSFADATQCGDGTIYRAAGFLLTGVSKNSTLVRLPGGAVVAGISYTKGRAILKDGAASLPKGTERLPGFQMRYILFLLPEARQRLTVPVLPYSAIAEAGAGMYLGKARE